jgi:transcription antitermination factor NusG
MKPATLLSRPYLWHALYIRPRWEKRVDIDLREQGYEVYLPMTRVKRKWSDRMKWVDLPLFSGYVFVRVSRREYDQVLKHPAVLRYIAFGGKASVVPGSQIEAIRRALGQGIDFEVTSKIFKPGQVVDVTAGPMTGCSGEIIRYAGSKSLLVRVGETGLNLLVKMPAAYLEAVGSTQ